MRQLPAVLLGCAVGVASTLLFQAFDALRQRDPSRIDQALVAQLCARGESTYFSGTPLAESERFYGPHMNAMGEPRLCWRSDREAYRFLWLRSFHNPILVRAERHANRCVLIVKQLDGAGHCEPGRLIRDYHIDLSPQDWDRFITLLEQADYWRMPVIGAHNGLDGARWILEGTHSGGYQVVDRWSPGAAGEDGAYLDACLLLIRLSGLEADSEQIY